MPRSAIERPLCRGAAFRHISFQDQAEQGHNTTTAKWQTQPHPTSIQDHFHFPNPSQTPHVAGELHYQAEHLRHQLRAACEMLSCPLTAEENGSDKDGSPNIPEGKGQNRIAQKLFDKEVYTVNG